MIERRRAELPGQEVDGLVEFLGQPLRPLDLRAHRQVVLGAGAQRLEVQAQRRHLLADLVVDVAGDAAPLLFLRRDQATEQRLNLPFGDVPLARLALERQVRRRELRRAIEHALLERVVGLCQRRLGTGALDRRPGAIGRLLTRPHSWGSHVRGTSALSVTAEVPRTWLPHECGLVQETADRTWAAVERARAEAALTQANDALEQRVLDRTAQLAASNLALQREARERDVAERQIKALFRRLISTQEEERRRIARDIHDQVGQQMTALRLHLEALRARAEDDLTMSAQVEGTQRLAEELDQTIDFLTWQLRPSTLDHLGLAASLKGLVRGWGERFGIIADFESSAPDLRLAADVETNLYRIAQEALHNVVKHAEARTVSVLLSRRDQHAMLVIEDDGRGFLPDAPPPLHSAAGFGLVSMRERATLVGGELEIDSTPGAGTSIFVRVPLPADVAG